MDYDNDIGSDNDVGYDDNIAYDNLHNYVPDVHDDNADDLGYNNYIGYDDDNLNDYVPDALPASFPLRESVAHTRNRLRAFQTLLQPDDFYDFYDDDDGDDDDGDDGDDDDDDEGDDDDAHRFIPSFISSLNSLQAVKPSFRLSRRARLCSKLVLYISKYPYI